MNAVSSGVRRILLCSKLVLHNSPIVHALWFSYAVSSLMVTGQLVLRGLQGDPVGALPLSGSHAFLSDVSFAS